MPIQIAFDATIDLLGHHLDDAGIPPNRSQEALEAVRDAVCGLPGAGWVDIAYQGRLSPTLCRSIGDRWITLYRPGSAKAQEGPEWNLVRRGIEKRIREALAAVREVSTT